MAKAKKPKVNNWEKFQAEDIETILKAQPQFADKMDLSLLGSREWLHVLSAHEELAGFGGLKKIDATYDAGDLFKAKPQLADSYDLSKLSSYSWARLLSVRPELAGKCKLGALQSADWVTLLSAQPQFAGKCNFSKLDAGAIGTLLKARPELADKCDFSKFKDDGDSLIELILAQPQFADKMDWSKVSAMPDSSASFCQKGLIHCALLQPALASKVDWSSVDPNKAIPAIFGSMLVVNNVHLYIENMAAIAKKHRGLVKKLDVGALDCQYVALALTAKPDLIDVFKKETVAKISGRDVYNILKSQPSLVDKLPLQNLMIDRLDNKAIAWLVDNVPGLTKECPQVFGWLDIRSWSWLIAQNPGYADKFPKKATGWELGRDWKDFKPSEWGTILSMQPQFADKCDWSKMDSRSVVEILCKQPQLADRYDIAKKLTESEWADLLAAQPQFVEQFESAKVKKAKR